MKRSASVRITAAASLMSMALLALPHSAPADTVITTSGQPTPVSAHGGRLAWSSFDPATGSYGLVTHFGGVTSAVPVASRRAPFDVDLGPDQNGDTVAAYSRCSVEPVSRNPAIGSAIANQIPQRSTGRGCFLYTFNFHTGRETAIATANSPHASQFLPTVWKARVAFARTYPRKGGVAGQRAYLYARPLVGAGRSTRLPAGSRASIRPSGGERLAEPGPMALDLAGTRVAFAWDSGTVDSPTSAIYLDTIRRGEVRQQRLALSYSGEIQGSELVSPAIDHGVVWWGATYFGDNTSNWVLRYRISDGFRDQALVPSGYRDGGYAGPVLWTAVDDTQLFYLASGIFGLGVQPGCTPQNACAPGPGCLPEQPCSIRGSAPLTFTAVPRAAPLGRAPRRAVQVGLRRARAHFRDDRRIRLGATLRSRVDRRWSLVTGGYAKRRLWAAWVRRSGSSRFSVAIFRTRDFSPGLRPPCDLRPAFSEPDC
jgi:hypothetical protein